VRAEASGVPPPRRYDPGMALAIHFHPGRLPLTACRLHDVTNAAGRTGFRSAHNHDSTLSGVAEQIAFYER